MKERIKTLDSLKLVAIFFVICIHTAPFFDVTTGKFSALGLFINQISRFAVPVFFVISGFLYALHFDAQQPSRRLIATARRLITLFLFWSLFYVIPYNVLLIPEYGVGAPWDFAYWHYRVWTENWENFFLVGSRVHLWFIPALLSATLISAPFVASGRNRCLLGVGGALYIIALLSGPYKNTLIGFDLGMNPRNGPFFSTVFFAFGVFIAQSGLSREVTLWPLVLALLGLLWHLSEFFWLHGHYANAAIYDFNSGTLVFAMGIALLGLNNAKPLRTQWLVENGKFTLGIYLLHLFLVDLMLPLNQRWSDSMLWDIAYPVVVFAITLILVKYLARFRLAEKLLN